jgi:hypothetical protein
MALARARAFQDSKAKEEELRNIEKLFKLTIVEPGDASTTVIDWTILICCRVLTCHDLLCVCVCVVTVW